MVEDCIFCKIVQKEVPASIIYEDDIVIAFMTIEPVNPGHFLIIPKKHMPYLADMDEETGGYLFKITMRLAEALRQSGIKVEGVNLFLADGEAAFQEVFHAHMHVFPRFEGDPFKIDADWNTSPSRNELDRIAENIRDTYESLSATRNKLSFNGQ